MLRDGVTVRRVVEEERQRDEHVSNLHIRRSRALRPDGNLSFPLVLNNVVDHQLEAPEEGQHGREVRSVCLVIHHGAA